MVIDIIALGESAKNYTDRGNTTVGVNDAWKIYPTEYLLSLDKPGRFTKERLKTITESKPLAFYSHISEWGAYFDQFKHMEISSVRNSVQELDTDKFCYSNSSPFTAVHLAYKLGASEIVMYGVDFVSHPKLTGEEEGPLRLTLRGFFDLSAELKKRNVTLYVSSKFSILSRFLPVYE